MKFDRYDSHDSTRQGIFMKNKFLFIVILAAAFPRLAFSQGSLTPPGAPVATMKSLDQISQQITNLNQQVTNLANLLTNQVNKNIDFAEPRYPIFDYQTNLTLSGSYYLTTNLVSGTNTNDGINIRTNISNITIDLNGFSIINTNGAGSASPVGVRISEGTNIVIRNAQIIGFA